MKTRDPFGLVGTVLDGRYRVDDVVAEGGFGVVYRAHHVSLDRAVALKALKLDEGPGRLPQFREHFAAEARLMARLKHPGIADVYDSGISNIGGRDIPWIALEWIDGVTLDERIEGQRGRGGLSPQEVMELLRPALQAFAHAHRHGIAHRDIKPANMMVLDAAAGSAGHGGAAVRVLDFGISKIMSPDEEAGSGRTRTGGAFAFSPGYASPEQISGGRTGPWTDVHAIGLVLTELLTDRTAVEGGDIALFAQILSEQRPTPASKGVDVGPWETVIGRALALQPSVRWKDAGALLEALEANVVEADRIALLSRRGGLGPTAKLPPAAPLAATVAAGASPELQAGNSGGGVISAVSLGGQAPASTTLTALPGSTMGGEEPGRRTRGRAAVVIAAALVATVVLVAIGLRGRGGPESRGGGTSAGVPPAASPGAGSGVVGTTTSEGRAGGATGTAAVMGADAGAGVTGGTAEGKAAAAPSVATSPTPANAGAGDHRRDSKPRGKKIVSAPGAAGAGAKARTAGGSGEEGGAAMRDGAQIPPATPTRAPDNRRLHDPSQLQIR